MTDYKPVTHSAVCVRCGSLGMLDRTPPPMYICRTCTDKALLVAGNDTKPRGRGVKEVR